MLFSGPGVNPSLKGLASNVVELQAGQVWPLTPSGWYNCRTGKYTVIQEYDPITTTWRTVGGGPSSGGIDFFYSDSNNYRLANQSGCVVGARVVTAGSGYTSTPIATVSAGGAIFKPIIGGLVNTTVTVTNGGTNYTYPPMVIFSAPPSPGVQATGYATLTSGVVSSVTVGDQGAGYVTAPTVTFINDPREGLNGVGIGSGAAAFTTLTGAGTLAALLCVDHGNPVTSLPTVTMSGGGSSSQGTAVLIPNFALTGFSFVSNSSGAGYAGSVLISAFGGFTTSTAAYLNPTIEQNLVHGRAGQIVSLLTGSALTTSGLTVNDGGSYPGVPSWISYYNTPPATAASLTMTVGGQNDVSIVLTT